MLRTEAELSRVVRLPQVDLGPTDNKDKTMAQHYRLHGLAVSAQQILLA